ncbi:hypothetical protein ACFLUY_02815 [Chloroflexota bacterium]
MQLAKEAGIHTVTSNFILGLPYETQQSLRDTIEFIRELPIDQARAGIVDIYPGSELYDMVERGEGGIRYLPGMRNNWQSFSRISCQTVVNDVTEADLLAAHDTIRKISAQSRPLTQLLGARNLQRQLGALLNDPSPERAIARIKLLIYAITNRIRGKIQHRK